MALMNLPREIIVEVVSFINDVRSITSLRAVNNELNQLADGYRYTEAKIGLRFFEPWDEHLSEEAIQFLYTHGYDVKYNLIVLACYYGYLTLLEEMMPEGQRFTVFPKFQLNVKPLLKETLTKKRMEMFRFLLERGFLEKAKFQTIVECLQEKHNFSSEMKQKQVVELVLQYAEPDSIRDYKILQYYSPFFKHAIDYLYRNRRDVYDECDQLYMRAVSLVIPHGYRNEITQCIIDHGYNVSFADLNHAIEYYDAESFDLFLKHPIQQTSDINPILKAVQSDNERALCRLLADGRFDPTDNRNAALLYSVQRMKSNFTKILLSDPRIDPLKYDDQIVIAALKSNHCGILSTLLRHPNVPPTLNQHILMIADMALFNKWECVKRLCQAGLHPIVTVAHVTVQE